MFLVISKNELAPDHRGNVRIEDATPHDNFESAAQELIECDRTDYVIVEVTLVAEYIVEKKYEVRRVNPNPQPEG